MGYLYESWQLMTAPEKMNLGTPDGPYSPRGPENSHGPFMDPSPETEAQAMREAMGSDLPAPTAKNYLEAGEFWGNIVAAVYLAPYRVARYVFDAIDVGIGIAKFTQDGNYTHAVPFVLGRTMTSGIGNIASGATAARAGIATSVTVDAAIELSPGYGGR